MINMNYYKQAFADRLKKLIDGKNIKDFCKDIDVSERTLNNWINKKRIPYKAYLILLSQKLNVSVDYLTGLKDY